MEYHAGGARLRQERWGSTLLPREEQQRAPNDSLLIEKPVLPVYARQLSSFWLLPFV